MSDVKSFFTFSNRLLSVLFQKTDTLTLFSFLKSNVRGEGRGGGERGAKKPDNYSFVTWITDLRQNFQSLHATIS
jgi:hypothetical protein